MYLCLYVSAGACVGLGQATFDLFSLQGGILSAHLRRSWLTILVYISGSRPLSMTNPRIGKYFLRNCLPPELMPLTCCYGVTLSSFVHQSHARWPPPCYIRPRMRINPGKSRDVMTSCHSSQEMTCSCHGSVPPCPDLFGTVRQVPVF